ncbi:MAG: MATE family efflux transporter [Gemmatimonadaceae bacterium]|nr:MATE family efflux transporter [Gemmatimonadaceae bacterium]
MPGPLDSSDVPPVPAAPAVPSVPAVDPPSPADALAATHATSGRTWQLVRLALRGSHLDYTKGAVGQAIIILAIPMVLEMSMESIFAVVDVFFVSRLGPQAIATVGLTESMLTLIYTIAMGLGIGATAMVSRRIGEHDPEGAARAAMQAIWLGIILSVSLGVAGAIFAPQLLALMGAEPSLIATGSTFTRVMLGGNASVLMLFLLNAIFRGAGDAAIAMRTLWLANAINIALGPCLIFGLGPFPEMGVTGAAVATTIGRSTGALYALARLLRPGGRVHLSPRFLRIEPVLMWRLVRLSASGTFQIFIGMASWVLLIRVLSSFGSEALAGYTIAMRIIMFALLPSWGMSNAAATMVGQALGAGKPDRAERAVWIAGRYNFVFLGVVGLAFVTLAPQIVSLFTADAGVAGYAIDCLRLVAMGFVFYAYGMVLTQAFNGAGDTWTPTLINLACFWAFEIPLAWFLAFTVGMGPHGVFVAITVAYTSIAVVSAVLFRRGRWKLKHV